VLTFCYNVGWPILSYVRDGQLGLDVMGSQMEQKPVPAQVDTVIVGNGPSALILSYILNGNIPYYNASNPHPDPILHRKLLQSPALLNVNVADFTAHFTASRLSYSTQALPINVLLDTLIRPLADTHPGEHRTCVEWRHEETKRVPHVVLGNTAHAGGQWADNPVSASWDIGTLSYAEMLSLPGYTFENHYYRINGRQPPDFHRPTRREVAGYLAIYPNMVNISDSVFTNVDVSGISRTIDGFHLAAPNVRCKHLVLASGIFANLIPPRPLLQPLAALHPSSSIRLTPLLIIGSGFTAADIIISTPPGRRIIHIFKWDPDEHPSPLRACHPRAYPEYASVYRQMKLAAKKSLNIHDSATPLRLKKCNPFFAQRNWDNTYEGFPNTFIKDVAMRDNLAIITLEGSSGRTFDREVSSMEYVVGRRGSLRFLDIEIDREVLGVDRQITGNSDMISGRTLRAKAEESLEVAPDVFIIGSLAGDSLIRFAFGGCIFAAHHIMERAGQISHQTTTEAGTIKIANGDITSKPLGMGIQTHSNNEYIMTNGHSDLGIDRKTRATSTDLEVRKVQVMA